MARSWGRLGEVGAPAEGLLRRLLAKTRRRWLNAGPLLAGRGLQRLAPDWRVLGHGYLGGG